MKPVFCSLLRLTTISALSMGTAPLYAADADNKATKHSPAHAQDGHSGGAQQGAHTEGHQDQDRHDDHDEGIETIVVQGIRSGRLVQDVPMQVEIISGDEVVEKALMRPGNISMLVNEIGGIRVQTTSPALGAANVRIQGLFGRYTQLMADGLPLYGGQSSSLGLLQIVPTDLSQVEVIKGSATALYGPAALGGVINLVSRRPSDEAENELLFNTTSQNGQDITAYLSRPLSDQLGVSLTTGAHRQSTQDFDGDGWIDMPGYERITARPRLNWRGTDGAELYTTVGYMTESRTGGTMVGRTVPDGSAFPQSQETTRIDSGLVADIPLTVNLDGQVRASGMVQNHDHLFGDIIEEDKHQSYLLEASVSGALDRSNWVAGLVWQSEIFTSQSFPAFDYTYSVPGAFMQVDHDLSETVSFSVSGRLDSHSEYGTSFSPRVSMLYRPGNWTFRGSVANGFFAPIPFVEEIEAAGLSRLASLDGLEKETAQTASLDIGYKQGPVEASATLFASDVKNITRLEAFSSGEGTSLDRVRLINTDGTTRLRGAELLLRYIWEDFKVTGNYVFVDSSEPSNLGIRQQVPLTPKHTAAMVAMWERHGEFRLGLELYYSGKQRVENNPFRTKSNDYLDIGILGEITFGKVSLFVNAENLLNVRQTRVEPLILPQRRASGQWTTDIWSRNDGFIINGGMRIKF